LIWDSAPWKRALLRDAGMLERWAVRKGKPERQGFIFEQKIFLSAYAIRKLFDARKVSDGLLKYTLACKRFQRTKKEISPLNAHRIDEHYVLDKPQGFKALGRRLLDQVIHSHVFILSSNKGGVVDGFFITSDRDKETHLLLVPLAAFCTYMREIGNDFPSRGSWERDSKTGKWKISVD
jgi:hypothetical protein